ncbi:hypothetical protein [Pseudomonas monteilii]|uniref:hypothetical protein n=1 Tax=Pseudomonas monteilii TaxID=76759 RepID=UPI001E3E3A7D|nr:hypothetical protein [Pseudomonas monteilii]MCE1010171.1 hypothetical protein [Pseudomonas monteilii]
MSDEKQLPPCDAEVFEKGESIGLFPGIKKEDVERLCKGLSAVTGWRIDWSYFAGRPHIRALAPAEQHQGKPVSFQSRVQPWLMECFGEMIAGDREERNHRFLEEALELVQSLGCSSAEAHQLVEYVFGREVGEPAQEVGGVMVTLAALCLANSLDMHQLGETELARVWTKVDAIRAKQASKPQFGPLPGAYPGRATSTPEEPDELTDLATWKRRAIEAESKLRTYDPQILELSQWEVQSLLAEPRPSEVVLMKCVLCDQLQADMTARDQRIDQFEQVMQKVATLRGTLEQHGLREEVEALLWPGLHSRPEERGTPETEPCSGCGTPGYTGNCNKCVPY